MARTAKAHAAAKNLTAKAHVAKKLTAKAVVAKKLMAKAHAAKKLTAKAVVAKKRMAKAHAAARKKQPVKASAAKVNVVAVNKPLVKACEVTHA